MPNIAKITLKPRATPEQIEELKESYANRDQARGEVGRTNFILMSSDGTKTPYYNQPCHGALSGCRIADRLLIITELAYNRNQWDNKDPSIYAPFLDWFINKSYMSRFILNKEDISVEEDKGLIVSCDMSALLMQNIMITSRHFREVSPDCFIKFNELVAAGVDGNIAYNITMLTTFSTLKKDIALIQPVMSYGGHRASPMYSIPDLRRLIKGDYGDRLNHSLNKRSRFYSQNSNYNGGPLLFKSSADIFNEIHRTGKTLVDNLFESSTGFVEALSSFRKEGEASKIYKPPNPFTLRQHTPVIVGPSQLSYEEFYAVAIPFIIEELKK